MADAFLHLPAEDRREALGVAADRSGRPAHLLEKDVWVVWALAILYGSPLGDHLVCTVQPIIAEALATESLSAVIRVEADRLFLDYEATTAGSGYVAPSVMLEFGALDR